MGVASSDLTNRSEGDSGQHWFQRCEGVEAVHWCTVHKNINPLDKEQFLLQQEPASCRLLQLYPPIGYMYTGTKKFVRQPCIAPDSPSQSYHSLWTYSEFTFYSKRVFVSRQCHKQHSDPASLVQFW
jgi:hypothetical protein